MTTTAQHTPGPWTVTRHTLTSRANHEVIEVIEADGVRIATVGPPDGAANAGLIAAAPDLLACLEETTEAHENTHYKCAIDSDDVCSVEAGGEHAMIREARATIEAARQS